MTQINTNKISEVK